MLIAAVADGHGSYQHDRSHIGAHLALQATVQSLGWLLLGIHQDAEINLERESYEQKSDRRQDKLEWLDKEIIISNASRSFCEYFPRRLCRTWRELIGFHGRSIGDSEEEISTPDFSKHYGTTLLVSALIGDVILLAQIGDGDIGLLEKRETEEWEVSFPLNSKNDLVGGETHSLCSSDASKLFRTEVISRSNISMITLSTDGLINAYEEDCSFKNLLITILDNNMVYGTKSATSVLPKYLDHFSSYGSGDDITLAGIYLEQLDQTEQLGHEHIKEFSAIDGRLKEE